jgi:hypothetical protein
MVRERRMSDRSFGWKPASLLLALTVLGFWAAPGPSLAINPPEKIVHDFLKQSFGKSLGVDVLAPQCANPDLSISDNPTCDDDGFVVKIKVQTEPRRKALAVILTDHMKQCEPADGSPCKFYGDTSKVLIQLVYKENGVEQIEPPADPIPGADLNEQIRNLKDMVARAFAKNRSWFRAFAQFEPGEDDPFVGVHLVFQPTSIQILTNVEDSWTGYSVFVPEDLYGLFMKTSVPTETGGEISLFTGTTR